MPILQTITRLHTSKFTIWLVGVFFVLFQFFLQLSSGVIIHSITIEMKLSALSTGFLSSSFYFIYTSMQIPVGLLFDKKSTKKLLAGSAILCSIGCILFALSHTLTHLILSRLIIGAGSSFAFVGISQILRQHFPLNQFAFMIGLSETLGFLVTMLGMIYLGNWVSDWGWRPFMQGAAVIGVIIAACCWYIIPNGQKQKSTYCSSAHTPNNTLDSLRNMITNPIAWFNGLFVALGFTVITVFAAMWAVPFLKIKLLCDLKIASQLDGMLFLGVAVSCPLLGYLADIVKSRKPLLISSSAITGILLLLLLYLPSQNQFLTGTLLFLIGLCCGGYMIAYSIANELAPKNALSTATGFTNTLATLSPLIQPFVGQIIDQLDAINPNASLQHYQYALTIVPLGLFVAAGLAIYLPDNK